MTPQGKPRARSKEGREPRAPKAEKRASGRRKLSQGRGPSRATAKQSGPYGDGPVLYGYVRDTTRPRLRITLYLALAVAWLAWGTYFGLSAPFQIMPMIAPLPLMVLLLVWILPRGEYAPTKFIEPLYLAFFAALVLWPNYVAIALPHMPWVTLLRLFAAPLVLVMLICISVSANFRGQLWSPIAGATEVWRMMIAFVAIQTISLVFSDRPVISVNKYIIDQLHHTCIFIVSCYVFLTPGFGDRWARMFLIMVYFVCFMGLWENAIGGLPWAGHIPSFLKIETDLVANILDGARRAIIGEHRVQAMSTQPLLMAELLGLATPFAFHIAMSKGFHWITRVAGLIYVPLALLLIELADSRLGYVAVLSAVMFYLLIWSSLRWRGNRGSLLAPAIVLAYPVILVTTIAATFFVGRLRNAVWGTGANAASNSAREMQWQIAIPKVLTHPLGHGLGEAGIKVGYVNPGGKLTLDSYYISLLMDFGIIGFALFMAIFLRVSWIGARDLIRYRAQGELSLLLPMTVALLQFVIIKSVLSQDANHPALYMILGGVLALSYRARQSAARAEATPA